MYKRNQIETLPGNKQQCKNVEKTEKLVKFWQQIATINCSRVTIEPVNSSCGTKHCSDSQNSDLNPQPIDDKHWEQDSYLSSWVKVWRQTIRRRIKTLKRVMSSEWKTVEDEHFRDLVCFSSTLDRWPGSFRYINIPLSNDSKCDKPHRQRCTDHEIQN